MNKIKESMMMTSDMASLRKAIQSEEEDSDEEDELPKIPQKQK